MLTLLQKCLAEEEQRFLQEKEKDILAVLLIQLDKSDTLSPDDAKQLHQDCLTIFKQKLVEHANLIQERCKKVEHRRSDHDVDLSPVVSS